MFATFRSVEIALLANVRVLLISSQLVENEELMGTLIETNERIIAAIEMYDTVRRIVYVYCMGVELCHSANISCPSQQ